MRGMNPNDPAAARVVAVDIGGTTITISLCEHAHRYAGPLEPAGGLILSPPNLPPWGALPIVKIMKDALGVPARLLVDLLAPQRIILGAIYQRSQHLLESAMRRVLREESLASSLDACTIVPARFSSELRYLAACAAATPAADHAASG